MKQSKTSVKVKMPSLSNEKQKYLTLCYDHPDQREFVFTIKGRPFSMLSTPKLPVPSTSLIDYNLVRDLGLKMEELQCSKFSYGGSRFRILGKISQTIQTIKDGVVSGTAHLSAAVVENLTATFDTHSIAGKKMTEFLEKKVDTNHSTEARYGSPSSPSSPRTSAAADSGARTAASPTASASSSPTSVPRSRGRCRTPTPAAHSESVEVFTSSLSEFSGLQSSLQSSLQKPHIPKVSSPKPLNGHYSTTYYVPQEKENLGHSCSGLGHDHIPARTLAVKPDDQHFYGRVRHIRHLERRGEYEVTMTHRRNNTYCHTINPFGVLSLQVGDLVLVKEYKCPAEAREDGHMDNFPILMVYNDEEESRLHALGESVPDGPPDLHPGGFYG